MLCTTSSGALKTSEQLQIKRGQFPSCFRFLVHADFPSSAEAPDARSAHYLG